MAGGKSPEWSQQLRKRMDVYAGYRCPLRWQYTCGRVVPDLPLRRSRWRGFAPSTTSRKAISARPPCTLRRPQRSPPTTAVVRSADLLGRHKVTSMCLSGFRRRPGDSTPTASWPCAVRGRAGGDRGVMCTAGRSTALPRRGIATAPQQMPLRGGRCACGARMGTFRQIAWRFDKSADRPALAG